MARETPDPDHPTATAVGEHQAHLEEDLEAGRDRLRGALVESLGAVPALQEELVTPGRLGQLALESLDLPAGDQRRKRPQGPHSPAEGLLVRVVGLLGRRLLPPVVRVPFGARIGGEG